MSRKLTAFSLGTNLNTEKVRQRVNVTEKETTAPVSSPLPAGPTKIKRERLNVVVPAEMFDWYRDLAHQHRVNMTDFVTHLMLDYMEQSGVDASLTGPLRPKNEIPRPE